MSNYPLVKIGDLCRIEKGQTGIQSALPGKYPLVTTGEERKSADSYQFDVAAVCIPLVSSTGHGKKSLNYVHYQEGKFALGTILAAVIPNDPQVLNAAYLQRYLQAYKDVTIVPWMKGAANVSLAMRDIARIEIPLPPIDEQQKIRHLLSLVDELDAQITRRKSIIEQLMRTIMHEALGG